MRVLIVSASAGAGHVRAGAALERAISHLAPDAEVEHVDVLDWTAPTYRKAYAGGFLAMVNRAPELWGALYRASDRPSRVQTRLARFFDKLEFASFRSMLRERKPDVLIATHFLPLQVLAPYRERGRDLLPLGVVITDFAVHSFWVQPTADAFFVASDEVAAILAGRGIAPDRIHVTGIPIAPEFAAAHDRSAIRAGLGLSDDAPTVLVTAGGAGVGSLADAVAAVLECGPVQVLAIAGRNRALLDRLRELQVPASSALHPFGFVDNMPELMAAADLAVAKSGGLTTSESLAMGLPMIVREPIPGQEERNADYLTEIGAGVKAHDDHALRYKLRLLLGDPARLAAMRAAARAAGRSRAAFGVAAAALAMASR